MTPLESPYETLLMTQLHWAHLPEPTRELRIIPGRRFRADFAWPAERLVVEVEGGTWIGGRHSRGKGFESDCEKQCLAVLDGWRYLRLTPSMIDDGRAIEWIRRALEQSKERAA
jgi:very-short-patch-repair endonuclease